MRLLFLVILSALPTFAADLKVGILDLDAAVQEYYRFKIVDQRLAGIRLSLEKEFESLKTEGEERAKEAERLREESLDLSLSSAQRAERQKAYESTLLDLRAFEVKYETFRRTSQSNYQSQAVQLTRGLMEDVMRMTYEIGHREGFHLVLRTSRTNPSASDVLFARDVEDITSRVVAVLNAGKPAAEPAE